MDIVFFFGAARTCIFRQCVTFHPNNLVHLRLCQHMQGAQVGSICKMQVRPIDVVVSLIFWDCFNGFLIELIENIQNMTVWPNMENMTFYDFISFDVDFVEVRFLFQNSFHSFLNHGKNMTFMTLNGHTNKLWRLLSFAIVIPQCVLMYYNFKKPLTNTSLVVTL